MTPGRATGTETEPTGPPRWLRAWAPPLLWSVIIFALSSIPGNQFPPMPGWWSADKLVHGAIYGVLGALCWRAMRATWARGQGTGMQIIAAVAVTGLYGITDELHQAFTPMRSPDPFDVIADIGGGLLGALVCVAILARRREKSPSERR
jgi:VanZ family protein